MTGVCMYTPSASGGHALYTKELLSCLLEQGTAPPTLVTSYDLASEFSQVPYEVVKLLPELRRKETFKHRLAWLAARVHHYWQREQRFLEWLKMRPDIGVIHFQEFAPWLAPYFFTQMKRLDKRLVYTVHNVRPHSRRFLALFYQEAWRRCDALIVHSSGLERELAELLGTCHPPIFVVPHGVWSAPSETPKPDFKTRLALRHLLFFGVIRENKGLHHLLDAMLELDGFSLTIAGSARDHRFYFEREILPRLAHLEARGIHVDLREGFVPDTELPALFGASSALVLPYENFSAQSGVLYLALAHEVPAIVSNAGALGETVEALSCGLVLDDCRPQSISRAVKVLYKASSSHEIEANLKRAKQQLSWSHAAKLTADIYHHVTDKGVEEGHHAK